MSATTKEQTRERILQGAGRTFRSQGYGGAGVDGLVKAAGMTSGAFYAYFKSKAEAFRATVVIGMQQLEFGIRHFREQHGARWIERFAAFYMSERRTCDLGESCALQSLTSEVARADDATRQAYEKELLAVLDAAAEGMPSTSAKARRAEAIALMALLSGGVSMARAIHDPELGEEIAAAIRTAAAQLSAAKPKQRTKPR
jgi:TetR/AcrR family transcriptional repressor of nem operon